MIQHIFKIIWVERKVNTWILLELILVFCVLWFCADYMYYTTKRYFQPKGFDIEHTYHITIGMKRQGWNDIDSGDSIKKAGIYDNAWTIYNRIKQYPLIETASLSSAAYPYSGASMSNSYMIDSTTIDMRVKRVTPEYFGVFKINIIKGKPFTEEDLVGGNNVILSGGNNNLFGKKTVEEMKTLYFDKEKSDSSKVIGIADRVKINDYEDYQCIQYKPLKINEEDVIIFNELCVRIKPEADKDFISRFSQDMRNQLEIGPFYLSGIKSIEKERELFMKQAGYTNNFKSIYSVTAFLIVNIFLGVLGTFWFRVQSRRSEIGLRIALGASKNNVKKMFIGESILLLFIASLVASIICINISAADLLKSINVPVPNRGEEGAGIAQHFINYGFTFAFLAAIAIVAVWYPAKKASDIQPTEALRDE
ncbi:ABC transporter permease [Dysgonomonas termitidis]|uniref:ABC transporter permease n=1 Tax=Dysgonomonas termitidis TaxID=1516126 RepID=A0ABV9L674_9BACT